jgi:hypothetical protein
VVSKKLKLTTRSIKLGAGAVYQLRPNFVLPLLDFVGFARHVGLGKT